MLTEESLERVLGAIPRLEVAVCGDLFLDRYLDIDAGLTEPSVETGLDAYQVIRVRSNPGAAGTVVNNLVALGVGAVHVVAVIGDDGEGHELRQALAAMAAVRTDTLYARRDRRTPTYTKPMLHESGQPPRELNRLDIKNRTPLPPESEADVLNALDRLWSHIDALLVLDQVKEPNCGVVTQAVRQRIAARAFADPQRIVLADSRERIGLFSQVRLKPNASECVGAVPEATSGPEAATLLARRAGRTVFSTCGEQGMLVAEPDRPAPIRVPAYPANAPIDPVGAGDSTSAAIACALASGLTAVEAAAFGNLVASITIQQLGTTGTATPEQIRQRWQSASEPERQRG
jgi:rfaE bifunctional protein kinase chain/domain